MVCRIDGVTVRFSPSQYEVFVQLYNARGSFLTTAQLFDGVYLDQLDFPFERIIYTMIFRLKKLLQPTRFRIHNFRSVGYRLIRLSPDGGTVDAAHLKRAA